MAPAKPVRLSASAARIRAGAFNLIIPLDSPSLPLESVTILLLPAISDALPALLHTPKSVSLVALDFTWFLARITARSAQAQATVKAAMPQPQRNA